MSELPSISVITVTYNLIEAGRADSFRRAVSCVREQSCDRLEHIIFDGASSDGSQELIREILEAEDAQHNNLTTVFVSEKDAGLYDAMNKAVERASGDYVLFLNSDDALASNDVLSKMQSLLAENEPDFAYGSTASRTDDGSEQISSRTSLRAVLQRMPFCHNSVLIRRDIFIALGGHNTEFPVASDYDLVLRMVASGHEGLKVDLPISLFWTRGASSDQDRVALDYARIWQNFFSEYRSAKSNMIDDYVKFYHQGHMPVRLMLEVLMTKTNCRNIRLAARHGLAKSLRRSLQPWREFGG